MSKILACSYCDKDYYDYYIHINQVDRFMCIDCYHADVPILSEKVGA
jgi:hypothetical protein